MTGASPNTLHIPMNLVFFLLAAIILFNCCTAIAAAASRFITKLFGFVSIILLMLALKACAST